MSHANIEANPFELEAAQTRAEIRAPRRRLRVSWSRGVGLVLPACVLAAWAVATQRHWVPVLLLPPPALVGRTLLEQVQSGDLIRNIGISLARVMAGFVLGGALGLILGVAMGLSRRVEEYVHPTFRAISQVPVLGWLPLAMMMLGIGESLKIALIAQASLIPVSLNTLTGIRAVPKAYVEVAHAFQFNRSQLLRRVVLPASVPSIFVGLRYGITQAWLSLVTVELLASSEGLGFMIVWGRQLFQLDLVMASIVVVGFVGLAIDRCVAALEARLLRWRPAAHWGGAS